MSHFIPKNSSTVSAFDGSISPSAFSVLSTPVSAPRRVEGERKTAEIGQATLMTSPKMPPVQGKKILLGERTRLSSPSSCRSQFSFLNQSVGDEEPEMMPPQQKRQDSLQTPPISSFETEFNDVSPMEEDSKELTSYYLPSRLFHGTLSSESLSVQESSSVVLTTPSPTSVQQNPLLKSMEEKNFQFTSPGLVAVAAQEIMDKHKQEQSLSQMRVAMFGRRRTPPANERTPSPLQFSQFASEMAPPKPKPIRLRSAITPMPHSHQTRSGEGNWLHRSRSLGPEEYHLFTQEEERAHPQAFDRVCKVEQIYP